MRAGKGIVPADDLVEQSGEDGEVDALQDTVEQPADREDSHGTGGGHHGSGDHGGDQAGEDVGHARGDVAGR